MKKLLILNGPNLNLLGQREPDVYGHQTLNDLEQQLKKTAHTLALDCEFFQSNHEGELIDRIHAAMGNVDGIIINAGAYTHTSIALRDALVGVNIPFVEVHLSNVFQREPFRHHSYLSDQAKGVICGLGISGYDAAMRYFHEQSSN